LLDGRGRVNRVDARKQLIATIANLTISARTCAPLGHFLYEGTRIELGAPDITHHYGTSNPSEKYQLAVPVLVHGQLVEKALSAGWILNYLKNYPRAVQNGITHHQAEIIKYTEHENTALAEMEKPFAKAADLATARQEQAEILKQVSQQPKDAADGEEALTEEVEEAVAA
jgi:hypothetical protein